MLIKGLGDRRILMCCVDAEDEEIIIPHHLLRKEYFWFKEIMRFVRSNDGMLRTIKYRVAGED